MEIQLRVYHIAAGHLDDFVAAWLARILPLRQSLGIEVEAWKQIDGDRFV